MVKVTTDGVWFAKNSDRDANEGQNLVWVPSRTNPSGATLRCTHIEIPDVAESHAVLLSQPFWMWGAEMGTNEHGVTIGNEAVFTTAGYERTPGLIGMDLLRLGLERAATAKEAVDVITALLEQHGQGGSCSYFRPEFEYHNGFLIADPEKAFVLETAGREWAVEEVSGARSISNGLTIPGFSEQFSDPVACAGNDCRLRQPRTDALANAGDSLLDFMNALQDHGLNHEHPEYKQSNGAMTSACVHAGGETKNAQTTGSWVSHLSAGRCTHWATGTAAPCVSLFKPVSVHERLELTKADDASNGSLWWRHELFHRRVLQNPELYRPLFIEERDSVQQQWLNEPPKSEDAFVKADSLLDAWTRKIQEVSHPDTRPVWAQEFWAKQNTAADIMYR
jgi:dipeptidase